MEAIVHEVKLHFSTILDKTQANTFLLEDHIFSVLEQTKSCACELLYFEAPQSS